MAGAETEETDGAHATYVLLDFMLKEMRGCWGLLLGV